MNWKLLAASVATVSLVVPQAGTPASSMSESPRAMHASAGRASAAAAARSALIAKLRTRVKYVFVLYQENRSFDSYFGTFPGANGIYSQPPSATRGYTQQIENVDGTFSNIQPFRIGPAQFAADTDDVNHAHQNLIKKIDVTADGPQMDKFALTEEDLHITGATPSLSAKQFGELTMAHEDCDTIPLLWNYANRFVLYDNVFQSELTPSTPGNLEILSAQSGATQWALHPTEAYTDNGASVPGVPVTNDDNPLWPSPASAAGTQINLTFASLPLTLAGSSIYSVAASDSRAALDFADTIDDGIAIHKQGEAPLSWGWFQEGYPNAGAEPSSSYSAHHNGPLYFGYVANSVERGNLHGIGAFTTAVTSGTLPASGGVFYVKGGFQNLLGLVPADSGNPAVVEDFPGDDDHPGYSDAQISEAVVASEINAIAASKYWNQSAIVVTWDDSEGDYDHVAPPLTSIGPGVGNEPADFLTHGPRVPLILISPYAKIHTIQHAYGDQGSVVKLVDDLFGLTPLESLPDEQKGLAAGASMGRLNLGPDDGPASGTDDLLDAFDPARLSGVAPPLPASYAMVPQYFISNLPQQTHLGCSAIGIIPVDYLRGINNQIPADFDPRPIEDAPANRAPSARHSVELAKDPDD